MNKRITRFFRTLLVTPYRLALRAWWLQLGKGPHVSEKRDVLLCAETEMMATYADAAAKLIADQAGVLIWLTQPPSPGMKSGALRGLAESMGHRFVSYALARAQWWDLIIFPEYRAADRFHPDIPKVLVNHFLGGGKIIDGKEYRFERSLEHLGRPLFRRIFDASFSSRDRAVAGDPALKDVITVVGDLRSDRLLSLRGQRDQIRAEYGFRPDQTVVLVQSTWGRQSIMERWGQQLLEEALRLQQQSPLRFIASTHPLHWSGRRAAEHPYGEYLLSLEPQGLSVVRPQDDWARSMIASDLVITDNTSLSATYCQLGKPLIFIDLPIGTIPPGSTVDRLYHISPHLHDPQDLEATIASVSLEYPYDRLIQIASEVNSFPGKAAEKMRHELLALLNSSES